MARRRVIAIAGGASAGPEALETAEAVGQRIVDAGHRIATGGRGGVMEAASRGARSASKYREGAVIGILPGLDASDANPYVDIALPTGLNHARNAVLVASADALVAIGGGAGTLSEIALAWTMDKPVIAVAVPGWSGRLAGKPLDSRRSDAIYEAGSADEVVALLNEILDDSL